MNFYEILPKMSIIHPIRMINMINSTDSINIINLYANAAKKHQMSLITNEKLAVMWICQIYELLGIFLKIYGWSEAYL